MGGITHSPASDGQDSLVEIHHYETSSMADPGRLGFFVALRDDISQGWVWLGRDDLPPRSIVRIKGSVERQAE